MSKQYILVPEFTLHEVIVKMIKFIREDFAQATDPEKTFLYEVCAATGMQRTNYFTIAKKVLLAEIDDPRLLEVELIYNMQRMGPPTIYISNPSESVGENGLSVDPNQDGRVEYANNEADPTEATDYRETYTRRFNSTYDIVFTSDNSNEVVALYHIFKAIFISLEGLGYMNFMGLENIKFGGKDLQIKSDAAKQMFAKALTLNLSYDTMSVDLFIKKYPVGLIIKGIMINE